MFRSYVYNRVYTGGKACVAKLTDDASYSWPVKVAACVLKKEY